MVGPGKSLAVLLACVTAGATGTAAGPPWLRPAAASAPAMPAGPGAGGPARVVLSEVVEPGYRDAVLAVVRKPTIATAAAGEDVVCTPAVYEWLLDHPDRVSLAWRRMKVPCVPITDAGNGQFTWEDGEGSELVWRTVGRFPDGLVWYATGKVKPSAVSPKVPMRAVVVMTHQKRPAGDGTAAISPAVRAYLQTDSKAAKVVMRLIGPAAPKIAEEGAEQLLYFFSGIALKVQAQPDRAKELLGPAR